MNEFTPINILNMINSIGEDATKLVLSNFSCPLNSDIEMFLSQNAIEFAKKKISMTYIVMNDSGQFAGYFTLTHKPITIKNESLSNTTRKRLARFSRYDTSTDSYHTSAFLIAQFGKNFASNLNTPFTGNILMNIAMKVLKQAQYLVGGNILFLECEDHPKLLKFYQDNRFLSFGKRNLENDQSKYIVQLISFF